MINGAFYGYSSKYIILDFYWARSTVSTPFQSLVFWWRNIVIYPKQQKPFIFKYETKKKPWFDVMWCLSFLLSFTGCFWAFHDFELPLYERKHLDSKCKFPHTRKLLLPPYECTSYTWPSWITYHLSHLLFRVKGLHGLYSYFPSCVTIYFSSVDIFSTLCEAKSERI